MSAKNVRVMVVEDEVLIGLMLVKKLKASGYEVGEVITTGEEAVECAGVFRPSVVLMDVTLAGRMNGIEAARRIRNSYKTPIIFFTGYNDTLLHEQARRVEPVAILAKMDPLEDILAAIRSAVS